MRCAHFCRSTAIRWNLNKKNTKRQRGADDVVELLSDGDNDAMLSTTSRRPSTTSSSISVADLRDLGKVSAFAQDARTSYLKKAFFLENNKDQEIGTQTWTGDYSKELGHVMLDKNICLGTFALPTVDEKRDPNEAEFNVEHKELFVRDGRSAPYGRWMNDEVMAFLGKAIAESSRVNEDKVPCIWMDTFLLRKLQLYFTATN
jgi:hypothetical protein